MKTLIISSSLSTDSRSFLLCQETSRLLSRRGVDVTLVDARKLSLLPFHQGPTADMIHLAKQVEATDNIIFGMGVHCYSINDGLKIILDGCFNGAAGKFFGILAAAGGEKSYLSTMHLTQICMNEWRMIQLPRVVYATGGDFDQNTIGNKGLQERLEKFAEEFKDIGERLIAV